MKDIVNLLKIPLNRYKGLELCRTLDTLSEAIINELILSSLKENDPSFNGEYIKICVKHRGVKTISNRLIKYFETGNFNEKIGSLKALYHVTEEPLIFNESTNKFVENPKFEDYKTAYKERELILIEAYNTCENIILKFFFKWAIPSKDNTFFIGVPDTFEELEIAIKNNSKLRLQLKHYREWI